MTNKPTEVTSRINMTGAWYGRYDIKRGDVFKVPSRREAEKLQAQGLVDVGRVSADKLGGAYEDDPEALQRFMREDRAEWEAGHPELAAKPGTELIGRRPMSAAGF